MMFPLGFLTIIHFFINPYRCQCQMSKTNLVCKKIGEVNKKKLFMTLKTYIYVFTVNHKVYIKILLHKPF